MNALKITQTHSKKKSKIDLYTPSQLKIFKIIKLLYLNITRFSSKALSYHRETYIPSRNIILFNFFSRVSFQNKQNKEHEREDEIEPKLKVHRPDPPFVLTS